MTIIRTKARRPQDHIYSVLVPHTSAYSYTYKYHKYSNNLALNKFKEPVFTTKEGKEFHKIIVYMYV